MLWDGLAGSDALERTRPPRVAFVRARLFDSSEGTMVEGRTGEGADVDGVAEVVAGDDGDTSEEKMLAQSEIAAGDAALEGELELECAPYVSQYASYVPAVACVGSWHDSGEVVAG